MTHAMITIIAALPREKVDAVRLEIESLFGNPANVAIRQRIEAQGADDALHFASLHALVTDGGARGHIVFEFSADGNDVDAVRRIADQLGEPLQAIFCHARDWTGRQSVETYLRRHIVTPGHGLFSKPGLCFAGTPGMTVGRIRREARLAKLVTSLISAQAGGLAPLDRVDSVRTALGGEWNWALDPPPGPAGDIIEMGTSGKIALMLTSFGKTYLWPFGIFLVLGSIYAAGTAQHHMAATAISFLWRAVLIIFAALIVIFGFTYRKLRHLEQRDWTNDRTVSRAAVGAMFERENHCAQNHMISQTVRKPGLVRAFTLRIALWVVATLSTVNAKPGFLSDIGTIHFARWVTIPGTRDLLFFSNYGGSWESYLEDFITKAHAGLTSVWSNTIGFPRTKNLFQDGATDGERFKQFARESMTHTSFWYSAYPDLSTANIRTNALIRRGLALAQSDDDAIRWLALFGSSLRPAEKLESSEIQSITFGGMGFMPHGQCLLINMPPNQVQAKEFLRWMMAHAAFNDGRMTQKNAVLTLAFGPSGFAKLGLPGVGLETFPAAFIDGMTSPSRARMLADIGQNAPENWWWGQTTPDLAVLVYAKTAADLAQLSADFMNQAHARSAAVIHHIPLVEVAGELKDRKEPFGFVDGVSQPSIKGTYRAVRSPDPAHIVEAGEFILGYPDNRGNLPPGPTLPATFDYEDALPIVGTEPGDARDLGRNGSFLVIRQLEQNVTAFKAFCNKESSRLQDRLTEPYAVTPEFIGAKMVGRWQDGSPLVRWPYQSASTISPDKKVDMDNEFMFGREDPEALRCPYGAHIRRANPRESFTPGSADQLAISNRHRILRVARGYVPQDGQGRGLFFMCLNSDIERQFEFVQQSWINSGHFHGLDGESDPMMGSEGGRFTIPTRDGPVQLSGLSQFVTLRGGGYFFLPGKRLLTFLSRA
jgi:Dyp-type peroxidase family